MQEYTPCAYFTTGNPFHHQAFIDWGLSDKDTSARIQEKIILEPFAGSGYLLNHLTEIEACNRYKAYDILPQRNDIERRDTLKDFPTGFDVCITNPPRLARNSATRQGFLFPDCSYDNVYKFALEKCLANCKWVAMLVPESFIKMVARSGKFEDRLTDFISIVQPLFKDTNHPVGLALFGPEKTDDVLVWSNEYCIGSLYYIRRFLPDVLKDGKRITFNVPNGNVGLIALDNTEEASIRFCEIEELRDYEVKTSGRHITKLQVDGDIHIDLWNAHLHMFRESTYDIFMTCYKGKRKDGMYRRRLDWELARAIIHTSEKIHLDKNFSSR